MALGRHWRKSRHGRSADAVAIYPKRFQTCLFRHQKSIRAGAPSSEAAGEIDMTIMMPASDQAVLGRRDAIVAALRAIVPGEGVIDSRPKCCPTSSMG